MGGDRSRLSPPDQASGEAIAIISQAVGADDVARLRHRVIELHHAAAPDAWRSDRKWHVEDLSTGGSLFDALAANRPLLEGARAWLGPDAFVLGMRYRAPLPGAGEQTFHTDDQLASGTPVRLVTAILALVDITSRDGAPRVLPPPMPSPSEVPDDPLVPVDGEEVVDLAAGDALIFTGNVWHSGTRNHSPRPRHAIAISYVQPGRGIAPVHRWAAPPDEAASRS